MTDTPVAFDEPMVVLAIGGDPAGMVRLPATIPAGSCVVAADSGLEHLARAGHGAHHVVGDLDSVDPAVLERSAAQGAVLHRHPADKDATDLELALHLVVEELAPAHGARRLLVVGPGGGRFDLLYADVGLLSGPATSSLRVTAHIDRATVRVVRPGAPRLLPGRPGEVVSLVPVHGAAHGVTTTGLRWPLADADLDAGSSRGLSNELVEPPGSVAIAAGVLVAIAPGEPAPPVPARTTPYDPTPRTPRNQP